MKLPRRALVLGLARSGQAAALALARRDVPTVGVDRAAGPDTGRLAEAGVEIHLGTEEEGLLDGVELLIKSPGVPGESPLAAVARARGIPIWSEVELGFRLLRNPFVGITGTNGKTTTSELLGAMFRAADRPVAVATGDQDPTVPTLNLDAREIERLFTDAGFNAVTVAVAQGRLAVAARKP